MNNKESRNEWKYFIKKMNENILWKNKRKYFRKKLTKIFYEKMNIIKKYIFTLQIRNW